MSAKRPPSAPPELPGFEYVSVLGSGGFADVFLYRQHVPKREVAVKVLLKDKVESAAAAESFSVEADLMAQLSSHPAIVSIFEAGVSRDGRPYLVMENCPRPNLQVRFRKEPLSVAESLRIGIQVAGAVETAHRAGILHRDIKPANILVTAYNRPALTDFGIAGATGGGDDAVGMSIPWSPPESFLDPPRSSPESDVYALATTIYTLLAGHSPFELPGERNTGALMIERIQSTPLPTLRRSDMPASLSAVLLRAMAKAPAGRYATALDLARALQRVQAELSMSVTSVDVLDDSVVDDKEEDEDDGRTRVRAIVSIDPDAPSTGTGTGRFTAPKPAPSVDTTGPSFGTTMPRAPSTWGRAAPVSDNDEGDHTVLRAGARSFNSPTLAPVPDVGDTVVRSSTPSPAAQDQGESPPRRQRQGLVVGIAVGVAALVGMGILWGTGVGADASPEEKTGEPAPIDVVPQELVPAPRDVVGELNGTVATFTWGPAELQDGVEFQWRVVGSGTSFASVPEASIEFDSTELGGACVEIRTRASSGRVSDVVEGCAT